MKNKVFFTIVTIAAFLLLGASYAVILNNQPSRSGVHWSEDVSGDMIIIDGDAFLLKQGNHTLPFSFDLRIPANLESLSCKNDSKNDPEDKVTIIYVDRETLYCAIWHIAVSNRLAISHVGTSSPYLGVPIENGEYEWLPPRSEFRNELKDGAGKLFESETLSPDEVKKFNLRVMLATLEREYPEEFKDKK